jgi:HEPN domain-containing protein
MGNKPEELARLWLKKAEHDLITARQTLLLPDGPTDTVCFHAQQAVEKALKALLTFNRVSFPKIHELVRLLDMAIAYLPELESFRTHFAEMSNYSVEVRYPDDWFQPSRNEAFKALSTAEEAVNRIVRCLTA